MSRLTFEDNFLYPLILLSIGFVITYFLGTLLPRKYQERQKNRDIEKEEGKVLLEKKHEVAKQITEMLGDFVSFKNTLIIIDDDDERLRQWNNMSNSLYKQNLIITLYLQTFFYKHAQEWVSIGHLMRQTIDILGMRDESKILEMWKKDDKVTSEYTDEQLKEAISKFDIKTMDKIIKKKAIDMAVKIIEKQ